MNNIKKAVGPTLLYIMENAYEPWAYRDNNSIFCYANQPYKDLLNLSKGYDIEGKRDGELPAPTAEFEPVFQEYDRLSRVRKERLHTLDVHILGKEQKLQAYKCTITPCIDNNHNVLGTIFSASKLQSHEIRTLFNAEQLITGSNSIKTLSKPVITPSSQGIDGKHQEVLFLTCAGLSNLEIKGKTGLQVKTIQNYKEHMRDHFDAANLQELKELCWKNGFMNSIPEGVLNVQSIAIQ